MKVALSTDNGYVAGHFGRCPQFTIVNIENKLVANKEIIDNPGHHPGFLPKFLSEKGVEVIIAGGMGHRAQELFCQHNIEIIVGITGKIDEVLSELIKGSLQGGESLCSPGAGKGYGLDKTECTHEHADNEEVNCHHEKNPDISSGDKICITAEGDNLDSNIDPRFGRCAYFILVNPQTLAFEAIQNPYKDSTGGAGIQAGQFVADQKVKAILTGHLGPNASKTLEAAEITTICDINGTVKAVIEQYNTGKLNPVTGPSVASHFGMSK